MLVILSGVETIHKKFFARKILATLNTFTVDGYNVDFNVEPFKVTDANGKIVYCMAHGDQPATNELLIDLDNDGVMNPEGNATFEKILELNNKLFLDGGRDNHFYGVFINIAYDLGLRDTLTFLETTDPNIPALRHPHTYNDVLENYRNRLGTTHVITGIFSKGFIDRIKNDIGAENVIALNIIRNPSVCCLLHEKSADFYANPEKDITPEIDAVKLEQSLANAAILAKSSDVITLKFENIIQDGKFTVNGVVVNAPDGYSLANECLTTWEKDNVVPLKIVSEETLNAFNTEFQHFASEKSAGLTEEDATMTNAFRAEPISLEEIKTKFAKNMPENLFDALGYAPLTIEEITD
jgi:hypothetical protein